MSTHAAHRLASEVVNGCWIVFAAFWLVAAFSTKKSVYRESFAQRWAVQLIVIAGAILMFTAPREPAPLNRFLIPQDAIVAFVSAALCLLGLTLALWARVTIGTNWSARVTLKEGHELIQRGPYGLVRHPIYTGLLTMALGSALLIGRVGAAVGWIVFLVAFWIKAGHEEALMLQQFPAQYAAYRQRTKRVIPFIF